MSRNRGRNSHVLELGVLLLFNELLNAGFTSIPPVTLMTVIGQTLLYIGIIEVPWTKWDVCISGKKVLINKDYKPLILSAIEHADDMHLYYNMISFIIKGRTLEKKYGSANFAFLLIIISLMTSGLYVCLAAFGAHVFEDPEMMSSCAIGFSGVIFALKFITTVDQSEGYSYVQGFQVPMRYTAWAELLAIHILVPNASFTGHLAGILAGFLYLKTPLKRLIDYFICNITGSQMNHNRASSSRSWYGWSHSNGYEGNGRHSSDYGWRFS